MTTQNSLSTRFNFSAFLPNASPNSNSISTGTNKSSFDNKSGFNLSSKTNTQNKFSPSGTDKSQGKATNTDSKTNEQKKFSFTNNKTTDSNLSSKTNTQNNFSPSGTDKSQGKTTNTDSKTNEQKKISFTNNKTTDSNLSSKMNTQNKFSPSGTDKSQGKATNTDSNKKNQPQSHYQNPFSRNLNTNKDNTFDDLESTSNNMPLISYLKSRHSKAKSNKTNPSKFEEINESFDTFNDSKTIVTFSLVNCTCKEMPLKVNKTDKNDEHQTEQTDQNHNDKNIDIKVKNQTETYDFNAELNQAKIRIKHIQAYDGDIGEPVFFKNIIKHIQDQQKTINQIVQLKLDIQNDINTIKNDDIVKSINGTYNEIAEKYNTIRSSK